MGEDKSKKDGKNDSEEKDAESVKSEDSKPSIDPKDAKIADLTDTLKHVQADFENYKKRVDRDKADFIKNSCRDFILKFLPLIDNLELALKNTSHKDEFVKGVEMIYAQFLQNLQELGVEPIDSLNKKFDPRLHEALLIEESDKVDIVLEELQKGYTLNGSVLRHAKVKIGKAGKR